MPMHKLKNKLSEKFKEYDSFKQGGNLYKANMDTLISERDRVRFMD